MPRRLSALLRLAALVAAALSLWGVAGPALAQAPPRLTIATHDEGSPFHQIGESLAALISSQMKIDVELRPHERWDRYIDKLDRGEIDFGFVTSIDAGAYYRGKGSERPYDNLRSVTRLWSIRYTYLSRAVLGIRNMAGLRGRRVGLLVEDDPTLTAVNAAVLQTVALRPEDLKAAALPTFAAGVDRLIGGRLEAVPIVVGLPVVIRARSNIAGGVNYVSLFGPNATSEFLAKLVPGLYAVTVNPDPRLPEIEEPITTAAYDVFLVTHRLVPDAVAAGVAGILHRHFPPLSERHAVLRLSSQTEVASPTNGVPYHPGVIAYYRSRGLWSDANNATETRLTTP